MMQRAARPNGQAAIRLFLGQFDQIVKDRPHDQCLQSRANHDIGPGLFASVVDHQPDRMVGICRHPFVKVGAEFQHLFPAFAFRGHLDGDEGCILNLNRAALDRRNQQIVAVFSAFQDGGEQLDQRHSPEGQAVMIPSAILGDADAEVCGRSGIVRVAVRIAGLAARQDR